jgi:hypothetical protein
VEAGVAVEARDTLGTDDQQERRSRLLLVHEEVVSGASLKAPAGTPHERRQQRPDDF